jgi:hypothetical protein
VVNSEEDEDNGEATIVSDGGVGPYSYQWDDPLGQITATATNLPPGLYTVVIVDNNGCESSCEVVIEEDDGPSGGCQTAFARYEDNNACFLDDSSIMNNRWGWTNFFASEGTYSMPLYSGAAQCDLSKGEQTGTVDVDYSNGMVTVTYNMFPGFVMTEAHLYVGGAPYPEKNGRSIVNPGQFPLKDDQLANVSTFEFGPIDVTGLNGIYVIAHAKTCSAPVTKAPTKTSVKVYHKPFTQSIDLDLSIPYEANVRVEFMDLSGKLVMKSGMRAAVPGDNMLQYNINRLATEVHVMKVNTGKEVISMKVYFVK